MITHLCLLRLQERTNSMLHDSIVIVEELIYKSCESTIMYSCSLSPSRDRTPLEYDTIQKLQ